MEGRDEKGKFSKGNSFWKERSSHGRNPDFQSPQELLSAANEYFQWASENPLKEEKAFSYQGKIIKAEISKMRPMTKGGLCIFIDLSLHRFNAMKEKGADFLNVITHIENVIYTQKFEGAAADLLNPNLIARDLGLSDKNEIDHTTNGEQVHFNLPTNGREKNN